MIVPKQREALAERIVAVNHSIKPPSLRGPRIAASERPGRRPGCALQSIGNDLKLLAFRLWTEQALDACGGPDGQIALQLRPRRAEPGPAMYVRDFLRIPRILPRRLEGCPRRGFIFHGNRPWNVVNRATESSRRRHSWFHRGER